MDYPYIASANEYIEIVKSFSAKFFEKRTMDENTKKFVKYICDYEKFRTENTKLKIGKKRNDLLEYLFKYYSTSDTVAFEIAK